MTVHSSHEREKKKKKSPSIMEQIIKAFTSGSGLGGKAAEARKRRKAKLDAAERRAGTR